MIQIAWLTGALMSETAAVQTLLDVWPRVETLSSSIFACELLAACNLYKYDAKKLFRVASGCFSGAECI